MRFSTFSAIATFAATALAQDLSSLPTCGTSCVGDGLTSTGCSQIDIACICNSSTWISDLSCCVSKACDPTDQDSIIKFAQQICAPVGVTNLPTSAGCTASSSATGTAASVSSGAGSVTSAAGGATSTVGSLLSSGISAVGSAASSAAASATAGAANVNGEHLGLGMGIAAAAGLFAAAL